MPWPLRRKPAGRRNRNGGIVKGRPPWTGTKRGRSGAPPPRTPDHVKIALMDYEVFGIAPEPGTAAAALIGLQEGARRLREAMAKPVDRSRCPHEDVVNTAGLGEQRVSGVCVRCGAPAVEGDDGSWTFP